MSIHRMEDGTVIDTSKSQQRWEEARDWDGNNHIGRSTGSQWHCQTLFKSRKGRYYIRHSSSWQGSRDHVEWVSAEEATRWLLHNQKELPEDLRKHEDSVLE